MGHKESNHSASIGDYITYAAYRTVESFLRLLPMEIVCCIGAGLGQLAYFLMTRRRKIVIKNLRIAYSSQLTLSQIYRLARQNFRHSGLNLMASVTASRFSDQELTERIQIEGMENIHHAYQQGHGCILLLGHMGNWEVLTQLKTLVPSITSLASLYRPLNNPLLDRLVRRRRQSRNAILYSRKDGFTKPITILRSGGALGVIADQNAGKHGMPVPFFGKLTSMTNLPALLHRKTKAPILPISMCTTALGRWKVILHPAINISEEERKDTYNITKRCAQAYENLMSESPADVLWMHNYWRIAKKTILKIRGTTPRNIHPLDLPFNKPFSLLIFAPAKLTPANIKDIITYLRSCRPDFHITVVGPEPAYSYADHSLTIDTSAPPHLTVNAIRNLENSMPTPFDCSLDLTENHSGKKLLQAAGLQKISTLTTHTSSTNFEDHVESFIQHIAPAPLPRS